MMTLTAREYFALPDNLHDLWWKPRVRIIRNANYYKLHSGSNFFTFHFSQVAARLKLFCIVESENGIAERGGKI